MSKPRIVRSIIASAVLALAAGSLSGNALAETRSATAVDAAKSTSGQLHKRSDKSRHGAHFAKHWAGAALPGVGPLSPDLLKTLALTEPQQAQLKTLRGSQRELGKKMRAAAGETRKLQAQQLESGKLDPRALLASRQQAREGLKTEAGQLQQQWLGWWDSLSEAQRGQVAEFAKARHDKMAARMTERKARHEARQERSES